jgi:hypothetical protein
MAAALIVAFRSAKGYLHLFASFRGAKGDTGHVTGRTCNENLAQKLSSILLLLPDQSKLGMKPNANIVNLMLGFARHSPRLQFH